MRFVPAGTSTAWPLIVSLGMCLFRDQRLELRAELLDVGDIGPDGAIVEGADRRAGAAARDVEDRVEVVLLPAPLHDPADHLVDPAGRLATGRTLPAALVGVEPRDDHH